MKVLVRFESETGYLSMVGMNNLFIIDDKRIRTRNGLIKRIRFFVENYHQGKRKRKFHVFNFHDNKFLFQSVIE